MDFWDFFWLMVYSFFFVAYLIVLFQIIADLFRDGDLSGWWKAVWILFLIFLPILTALVYLIARGKGMTDRHLQAAAETKRDTDRYIREVANTSPTDQIANAKQLLDSGAITSAEFESLKARALA